MRPGDVPIGVTLVDARAQRRKLYSPLLDRVLPPFIPSMNLATIRTIREAAFVFSGWTIEERLGARKATRREWRNTLVWAAVLIVLLNQLRSLWIIGVVAALGAIPIAIITLRQRYSFFPAGPHAVAAAMIQHGRCPACAYELSESDDGVTRACAECGAHWNTDVSEWA